MDGWIDGFPMLINNQRLLFLLNHAYLYNTPPSYNLSTYMYLFWWQYITEILHLPKIMLSIERCSLYFLINYFRYIHHTLTCSFLYYNVKVECPNGVGLIDKKRYTKFELDVIIFVIFFHTFNSFCSMMMS